MKEMLIAFVIGAFVSFAVLAIMADEINSEGMVFYVKD